MESSVVAQWLDRVLSGFDQQALGAIHAMQQSHAQAVLTPMALALHWIGTAGLGLILLGLMLLLRKKSRPAGMTVLLALALGFLITNLCLKPWVMRPRPYVGGGAMLHQWWVEAGALLESSLSFPSGHATAAMAAMTAIFWQGNRRRSWMAFLFAAAMGLSRCYLMVHYPSDVVGGLVVGFLAGTGAYICVRLMTGLRRERAM